MFFLLAHVQSFSADVTRQQLQELRAVTAARGQFLPPNTLFALYKKNGRDSVFGPRGLVAP
jgi:hypothetical protein